MSTLTASVRILYTLFSVRPVWHIRLMFDAYSTYYSPLLWGEIFAATYGRQALGVDDPLWDDLFLRRRMFPALRVTLRHIKRHGLCQLVHIPL
jgi:hypothetical protein